jgi:hypothetical protein
LCLLALAGCATTSGPPPRVTLGCPDRVSIAVTPGGAVELHDRGRVRRTIVRAEEREDLDRLLFAVGVRSWPACPPAGGGCGLRVVMASGYCTLAPEGVFRSSPGHSLLATLGDVVDRELGAGRRAGLLR